MHRRLFDYFGAIMQLQAAATALIDPENQAQLQQFDAALAATTTPTAADLAAVFSVFERHPYADGFGVFWTALHWLEARPVAQYHSALSNSINRKPVSFVLNMVNRLLNGGVDQLTGVAPSLRTMLKQVTLRADVPPEFVTEAQEIIARHAPEAPAASPASNSHPVCFDRILEAWNCHDIVATRSLLESAVTNDIVFIDPSIHAVGIDAFEANLRQFRSKYPDAVVRRTSAIDSHHDLHRYSWDIAVKDQIILHGFDVAETHADGKCMRVLGFFGALPLLS
jgi:hypothetical protein